jgi:hypothetical protein
MGAGTLAGVTTTDRLSMSSVPIAPLPKKSNELFWLLPGVKVKLCNVPGMGEPKTARRRIEGASSASYSAEVSSVCDREP